MYLLTKDLAAHEKEEDTYLAAALPERVFMTQTIPQTTYVLITIVTLGVGGVYWLYKVVNLYNAHYKADLTSRERNWTVDGGRGKCRAHVKNADLLVTVATFGVLAENITFHLKKCLNSADPSTLWGLHRKPWNPSKQNARLIKFYPDPNPVEFKSAIAKYVGHGVKAENILLGNGSIELIYMITEALPQSFQSGHSCAILLRIRKGSHCESAAK